MTNHIDKWLTAQKRSIFGGIRKPRRGKSTYAFLLTFPFFFVPILLAGCVVAEVGDSLSKKAVAFLQSVEKRPAGGERTVAVARGPLKKRSLVASKTN